MHFFILHAFTFSVKLSVLFEVSNFEMYKFWISSSYSLLFIIIVIVIAAGAKISTFWWITENVFLFHILFHQNISICINENKNVDLWIEVRFRMCWFVCWQFDYIPVIQTNKFLIETFKTILSSLRFYHNFFYYAIVITSLPAIIKLMEKQKNPNFKHAKVAKPCTNMIFNWKQGASSMKTKPSTQPIK